MSFPKTTVVVIVMCEAEWVEVLDLGPQQNVNADKHYDDEHDDLGHQAAEQPTEEIPALLSDCCTACLG